MTAPGRSDWLSVLTLGLVWGGTFMVISVALEGYGPLTVACARTTLGAVALTALALGMGKRLPAGSLRLWVIVAGAGLLSTAVPFVLLSWGQQHVPSAFAGISMAAVPLFVLPLAHLFSDEPLVLRKATGVSVGFAGALVLIGPGLASLGQGAEPLAQLACIGAAASYAVASILTRNCPPIDPLVLAALSLVVGAAVLIPVTLAVEGVPGWAGPRAGSALLFLGLVPTALATLLRTRVIRSAGSVFMTLVNYQVPVWSMALGALILSEELPWRFFAALTLILTGLFISQAPSLRRLLSS
ncbi:MAG: Permeases of the drug/metabolite transporter (DMT) superfamily [Rhodobacteraceae bacterium HLUCCA08]|nr:MAG: Permeases of the drug/metabolite transporter (DMT) superfamily [Rhodobacteraceae bacterium HLUCCA08]